MPTVSFNDISGNPEQIAEELAMMRKELMWLLENLDHLNVKRLYTEYCAIRSKDGETVIDGPVLEMYDKQATPELRLKMGYDPASSDFVFAMYDASGNNTIGIDSNGRAFFSGDITSDSVITGATIRSGPLETSRIELSGNTLKGIFYDTISETDQVSGLYFNITDVGIVDLLLYHNDAQLLSFYDDITHYTIKPGSGSSQLNVGEAGKTVYAIGSWDFTSATISGLETDSQGIHDHGGATGEALGHTHSIGIAGLHSHTVT